MSMLPFAIKTNMVNALKSADVPLKAHTDFMQLLLEEHESAKARPQLKELWEKWIETHYDEEPTPAAAQNQAPRSSIGKVATPPGTPKTTIGPPAGVWRPHRFETNVVVQKQCEPC